MRKVLFLALGLPLCAFLIFAAEDVATAVTGTVKKIDAGAKTVVVKTADGTEETFHYVGKTTVHGAEASAKGTKDALHGLKEGSEVAVHYTAKGTEKTAHEFDRLGKDGMRATEGTVKTIDRGAKSLTVKTANGAEETYHIADRAVRDTGKGVGEGTEKAVKVTVYYTEEGGKKIAHFFKKAVE
jgi:Cu/Ag efflux protein CusF